MKVKVLIVVTLKRKLRMHITASISNGMMNKRLNYILLYRVGE